MNKVKYVLLVVIVICSFVFSSLSIFGLERVPEEINKIAKSGINNFKESVNAQKEAFGLTKNDDINNLNIGEGYICYMTYKPEIDKVKEYKNKSSIDKMFVKVDIFVFPVYVGTKSIGTTTVEKVGGKWEVTGITGLSEFSNNLKLAEEETKKFNGNKDLKNDANAILVYDQANRLYAIATKSGYDDIIIPIMDNDSMSIKKLVKRSISETSDSLIKVINERNTEGGSGTEMGGGEFQPQYIVYASLCLLAITSGFFIIIRRKNSSRTVA